LHGPKNDWIKKHLDDRNNADSGKHCLSNIGNLGGNYIWLAKNETPNFLKHLNPFWKDVYKAWSTLRKTENETEPQKEPIFHNQNIRINNKSVYFQDWHWAGVTFINDILDENRNLYKWEDFSQKFDIHNQVFRYNSLYMLFQETGKKE
jgi:hypothetical protein